MRFQRLARITARPSSFPLLPDPTSADKICNSGPLERIIKSVTHGTPSEIIEVISDLCAADCAQALLYTPNFDCPPDAFLFRPFLEGMSPEGPEFILKPTKADAGPLAWSMEQALGALELE